MTVENLIPDEDRFKAYEVIGATTNFPVPFPVYAGTGADAALDLDVRVNGARITAYTVTGTFNRDAIPNVCLDATVVLDLAVANAEVTIQGDWRPRRVDQFPESQRVPPRNLNAVMNAITAGLREAYQRTRATFLLPPGEASAQLPAADVRAGMVLSFDADGGPETIVAKGDIENAAQNAAIAAAAATAAQTFNPALYLSKAGNLAGIANPAAARDILFISAENTPFDNTGVGLSGGPEEVQAAIAALKAAVDAAAAASAVRVLHVQDRKTAGTAGGTFTAGSFVTRTLNTVVTNTIPGASLNGSNQIILPAGTYRVNAAAIAFAVDAHKALFSDVTNAVTLALGLTQHSPNATSGSINMGDQVPAMVRGVFTLSSTTTCELRHRCATTKATDGFGVGVSSFGVQDVFADVLIEKIG